MRPALSSATRSACFRRRVDALFDNGRRGRVITGANKRPLKSLSDMLKGKQGRFPSEPARQARRLFRSVRHRDGSGAQAATSAACPRRWRSNSSSPFIYARLDAKGYSSTVKQAKKLVEKGKAGSLGYPRRGHPRASGAAQPRTDAPPPRHPGFFEPVLIERQGDPAAPRSSARPSKRRLRRRSDGCHVPLSLEAQLEARVLMMSTNNILHPASGAPIIVPSQEQWFSAST